MSRTVRVKAAYVTVPRSAESGSRVASTGAVVSVPDAVGDRWVRLGAAELVDDAPAQGEGGSSSGAPLVPVVVEVDGHEVDLSTIDDADRLREIAATVGLEVPGNVKKPETLRERITEHVNAQGEGGNG